MDEVLHILDSTDAEMLGISETWLPSDITDEMIGVSGYHVLRTDWDQNAGKSRGGGVSFL